MARHVIQAHNVALAQFERQNFLHTGLEGVAVDSPIDHERRDEVARPQRADERRRFPAPMRIAALQSLALSEHFRVRRG